MPLPQMTQFAEEMNLIWVPVNPAEFLDLGFCVGTARLWIALDFGAFFDTPLKHSDAGYDNGNGDEADVNSLRHVFKLLGVFDHFPLFQQCLCYYKSSFCFYLEGKVWQLSLSL